MMQSPDFVRRLEFLAAARRPSGETQSSFAGFFGRLRIRTRFGLQESLGGGDYGDSGQQDDS
jgi:hypothetical protein